MGAYVSAHEPAHHVSSPSKPSPPGAPAGRGTALRPPSGAACGGGAREARQQGALDGPFDPERPGRAQGVGRTPRPVRVALAWGLPRRGQAPSVPDPAKPFRPV
ncbi:MAG: hypothetical protein E6J46_03470 [Chloroflexi bacterium]|nr:MAG: hypothetical protein E6J46_03470 [Chloroflexota bacterium]